MFSFSVIVLDDSFSIAFCVSSFVFVTFMLLICITLFLSQCFIISLAVTR